MDKILKKIVNMVKIYQLVKIDFEEDFEEVDVLRRETIELEDDSPASFSSGIYEDPIYEEEDYETADVTFFVTTPAVMADVTFYVSTPAVMADVTFFVTTPAARADSTFYASTPAARANGTFFVATPAARVSSGIYEEEEGDCETDNRLNVTYCQAPLASSTTSTSNSSLEDSLTEECVLALALAYTTISISALEDSVFLYDEIIGEDTEDDNVFGHPI